MHVDLIETLSDFRGLEDNWRAVYESDSEANYFLSWDWIARTLDRLGEDWRILAVRPDIPNAEYIAFLPLRTTTYVSKRHQVLCNELVMPGFVLWADYSGLICVPDYDSTAIPSLARAIQQQDWAQLELKQIRMSEQRLQLFLEPFKDAAFVIEDRPRGRNEDGVDNDICPYVDLPDDFDQYLTEKLSSNKRHKLRRFLRMVERSSELRVTESLPATHERDVEILVGFWRQMWAEKKGDRIDSLARKFKEILLAAAQAGDLYLPMLWNGETPVAALGTYVDRNKNAMFVKATGRDQNWKLPPPGLVLHGHSIRWAIQHGIKTYDFMRGDEDYKYYYGATDVRIKNLLVRTSSRLNLHRRLDPLSIAEVYDRGKMLQDEEQWEKATSSYRQVLEVRPEHVGAMRGLAEILFRHQRFDAAIQVAGKLVQADADTGASWRLYGNALLCRKLFGEAETAFRRAIEIEPTMTDHFCLGCALQQQARNSEAVEQLQKVLQFNASQPSEVKIQSNAKRLLAAFTKSE